jgi:hypothetical protein
MPLFGGGIPETVPVSDEGVEVDRSPVDIITQGDVDEVEDLIPETEGEPADVEDLGSGAEEVIPTTTAPEEVWNVNETLEIIGEDSLDHFVLFINNFTRKLVEKNLNKSPRQDLSVEQIRQTKITKQLIKVIHSYAPSVPLNNPTTGLFICILTLAAMNATSPLISKEELDKMEKM